MARPQYEEPVAPKCHFDPSSLMDAIEELSGQIESLRAGLTSLDQKVTQMRTVEHQNLLQTVKQLRSAMDMATRDNKRQLESLGSQVLAATVRIQSLDLAMSNRKLEELASRAQASKAAAARTPAAEKGKAGAAEKPTR